MLGNIVSRVQAAIQRACSRSCVRRSGGGGAAAALSAGHPHGVLCDPVAGCHMCLFLSLSFCSVYAYRLVLGLSVFVCLCLHKALLALLKCWNVVPPCCYGLAAALSVCCVCCSVPHSSAGTGAGAVPGGQLGRARRACGAARAAAGRGGHRARPVRGLRTHHRLLGAHRRRVPVLVLPHAALGGQARSPASPAPSLWQAAGSQPGCWTCGADCMMHKAGLLHRLCSPEDFSELLSSDWFFFQGGRQRDEETAVLGGLSIWVACGGR